MPDIVNVCDLQASTAVGAMWVSSVKVPVPEGAMVLVLPSAWRRPLPSRARSSVVTVPATQASAAPVAPDEPALIEVTSTGYSLGLLIVIVTVLSAPGYRSAPKVPGAIVESTELFDWAVAEPLPLDDQAA